MVNRFVTVGDDLILPVAVSVPVARLLGQVNLDNTSDGTTRVALTPAQLAIVNGITASLALKAPLASPTFTGTVSGVTKAHVGLTNVDNTSDLNKPLSTAETAALALKAPLASPTFTGTVAGVTKTMVGLSNVDNTSDMNKPVSTAQAAAIAAGGGGGSTISRVTLTGSYVVTPNVLWDHETTYAMVLTQDATGNRAVTYASTVAAADGDFLPTVSPVPDSETWIGFVWSAAVSKWIPTLISTVTPPDTTPPVAGTMAVSAIGPTGFTLTVSGASDTRGLDSAPYSFDNGDGAWTAYQSSPILVVTGKTVSTAYNTKHRVKDAAGNVTVGATVVATTIASFSMALTAHATDATDAATYTYPTVSFGSPQSDRVMVMGVQWRAGAAVTLTSATIGGVTATIDLQGNVATSTGIAIVRAAVPTGTTGTIVLNFSGTVARVGYGIYREVGAVLSPVSTAIHATAATVTNPTGGYVVAVGFTPTNSMTGVTSAYSDANEGYFFMGGNSTTAGSVTATVSGGFSGVGAVAYGVS